MQHIIVEHYSFDKLKLKLKEDIFDIKTWTTLYNLYLCHLNYRGEGLL